MNLPASSQVTARFRSPAEVPPAGLEPAAYRLGGRASVAVCVLVIAMASAIRDLSSHTSPTESLCRPTLHDLSTMTGDRDCPRRRL